MYIHGEIVNMLEEPSTNIDYDVGTIQMVNDAYRENWPLMVEEEDIWEKPNVEARRFFDMLDASN